MAAAKAARLLAVAAHCCGWALEVARSRCGYKNVNRVVADMLGVYGVFGVLNRFDSSIVSASMMTAALFLFFVACQALLNFQKGDFFRPFLAGRSESLCGSIERVYYVNASQSRCDTKRKKRKEWNESASCLWRLVLKEGGGVVVVVVVGELPLNKGTLL